MDLYKASMFFDNKHTVLQTDRRENIIQANRQTYRQIVGHTDRQVKRQTNGQTYRKTDRRKDR